MGRWHERIDLKAADHMAIASHKLNQAAKGNRLILVLNLVMLAVIGYMLYKAKW